MGMERTSNNFDVDAIMRAVAAETPPQASGEYDVDPVADAFASDVEEMIDDLRFNPSTNLAEEAAQILNSPLAARLDSGVLMNLRAAVNLQEEKQENGGTAFGNSEAWNERRERDERDRKEQARATDLADDAMSNQLSTVPDRYGLSQQNYAELNDDLKTRDGQERFMNFMRMLHPELSDAQIRQRLDIANAITAERSGRGNAETRRVLETAPPSVVNDVSGDLSRYSAATLENGNSPRIADRVDGLASIGSADAPSFDPQAATGARTDILSSGDTTAPRLTASSPAISRVSVSAQVDGQAAITGAPSLRGQFGAALTATTPLDAPQLAASTVAPPAPAPAAIASSGFDV